MSRFMNYETKVHCAIQGSRMTAVCTYPARTAALDRSRELIHSHGKLFVKRGEWVHDIPEMQRMPAMVFFFDAFFFAATLP